MIHEGGLDSYYTLKDAVTSPAELAVTPPRDHGWLASLQQTAETAAGNGETASMTVSIQGISCVGCVWLVEKIHARQPGAGRIEINAQTGQARLTWLRGRFDAPALAGELQRFNYLVGPAHAAADGPSESQQLVRRVGLCTAFAMNVMLFTLPTYFGLEAASTYTHLFSTLAMGFATLSLLSGGGYFLSRAVRALREKLLHIDLPIALGIVGAYLGSFYGWLSQREEYQYFDFVSGFIVLMLVGRWAQIAAVERNQRRLLSEQPAAPRVRVYEADGRSSELAPESLAAGQHYGVASGQTVPVDSVLVTLEAGFNLAWINGESTPRLFRASQKIPAGAQNLSRGEVRLLATQSWENSLLAQLLKPDARAGYRHRLLERVIQGYLIAIIAAAALSGGVWWWLTGDLVHAGAVVTAVLVVSCPCALGLAFPLTDEIATVVLRRRGVFVRSADLWPRLAKVDRVVFDKTGTLTLETPELRNPDTLSSLDSEARSALFALVADSPHPVSRCLHAALLALGETLPLPGTPREVIGSGVELGPICADSDGPGSARGPRAEVGGSPDSSDPAASKLAPYSDPRPAGRRTPHASRACSPDLRTAHPPPRLTSAVIWRLGRADWATHSRIPRAAGEHETVLTRNGTVVASFFCQDTVRSEAREELAALAARGLPATILSGDLQTKVTELARELGLPEERALGGKSPQSKAAWLETHHADRTLMLGDGANDSLAFDSALCRGTPVIHRGHLEHKADFYFLGRGIAGIRALFEVNDARARTQRALLIFMIAYNCVAVGLSVTGHMNPLFAAVLMPLSSLATLAIVGVGLRPIRQRLLPKTP
jgi:Cu2+-exporting ATPase